MIKLPNTLQEVFDIVSKHLLKQNAKSKSFYKPELGLNCAYRGVNETKCAAGCLISDEEYKPEFEGDSWHNLVDKKFVEDKFNSEICVLQSIHDSYVVESWKQLLIEFAVTHNLVCNFES
jgi:hypothetical protein